MDDLAYRLLDYVCRNVSYKSDNGEFWEFPVEVLTKRAADCDGTALLLVSMLRRFYPADRVYAVVGSYRGYGHAWCFPGDTKIICIQGGRYKAIEIGNLQNFSGIEALSYNFESRAFEPKPITGFRYQGARRIIKAILRGAASIRCTPEHPFPVKWGDNRCALRQIGDIGQDPHCSKILIAKEIPALNKLEIQDAQLALEGIFAAEGSTTAYQNTRYKKVRISNTNPEIIFGVTRDLNSLQVGYGTYWQDDSRKGRKPCCHITISPSQLKDILCKMGTNHKDKHFLEDRLSVSKAQAKILLDNFAKGDGYESRPKPECVNQYRGYTTTSPELAWQLAFLHKLLGQRIRILEWAQNERRYLKLTSYRDSYRKYNTLPSLLGREVKDIREDGEDEVYDIEVADNHNFVLADSFALAHNCELDGEILETTYTSARPVADPQQYRAYAKFNDQEVVELWPGALTRLFQVARDEGMKLALMAEAVNGR